MVHTQQNGKSPEIIDISWGRITLANQAVFKDAKLYPGGSREWDWRETDTHHVPGVQWTDVEELIQKGAEIIVLTRGMWGRLRVAHVTQEKLKELGIDVHIHRTQRAVEVYNSLRKTQPVGGLFHSTC